MHAELLQFLLECLVASTAACLMVLLLRRPWRRAFGSTSVPLLWALVPAVLLGVALPAPADAPMALPWVAASPDPLQALGVASSAPIAALSLQSVLVAIWLLGSLLSTVYFVLLQRRFTRGLGQVRALADGIGMAASPDCGPAVVGLLRPRIVLPSDFETRYGREERALILAHERSHLRRGDIIANAAASALRIVYWFNPLLHYAAERMRHDHELASDADVLAQYPNARRRYADTLLNVQLAVPGLPVGCLWQSSHPLKERITMLSKSSSSQRRKAGTSLAIAALLSASALAWAAQPQRLARDSGSANQAATVDAGEDVSYARMAPPSYPSEAFKAGQSGSVLLKVLVDANGKAKQVEVEQATNPGVFDANAIAAVAKWEFNPARRDGKSVESWVRVPICFSLDKQQASCEAWPDALDGVSTVKPAGNG